MNCLLCRNNMEPRRSIWKLHLANFLQKVWTEINQQIAHMGLSLAHKHFTVSFIILSLTNTCQLTPSRRPGSCSSGGGGDNRDETEAGLSSSPVVFSVPTVVLPLPDPLDLSTLRLSSFPRPRSGPTRRIVRGGPRKIQWFKGMALHQYCLISLPF
jgi:hypothetical protein